MENNSYDVFVESALQLAESIVLKSDETARAVNTQLTVLYGQNVVNPLLPTTWKYYLNISGQYHATDAVMRVVSLDTLQTIDFTLQNLQSHTATRKAYLYGTTLYKELVERYPGQERLILGILYPVEINAAIAAPHGTILAYPPTLVEPYEYTFIAQLQEWIYGFLSRWDNVQFGNSDNLYKVSLYGNLFAFLAVEVLQIRLRMCKTNEVHTYHLRQYLASHGMLDAYLNYLTRSQALFLYRNIAYIERNSGKNAVFEWLVEHIMTERNLPLAAYQMRHDVTGMPAELRPLISFEKLPLNTAQNNDMVNTYSAQAVYTKEDPLARDNLLYKEDEFPAAVEDMTYSLSGRLDTKLLESTVVDTTGSEHYTLADTLLHHWVWLSHNSLYTTYINFNSPLNDELIILPVKDAFVFYFYAMLKINGGETPAEDLPLVMAKRVTRLPKPTRASLLAVATSRVSQAWAQMQLDHMPPLTPMISTDSFYNYCKELHQYSLQQYWMVCQEPAMRTYAQKYAVMSRCWANAWIQLGDGASSFSTWFAQRNIAIDDFTDADLASVAQILVEKSTGVDGLNAITLKDIQDAMIRLMTQLSSYSVQYIAEINDGAILDAPNSTIRLDNLGAQAQALNSYETAVRVMSYDSDIQHEITMDTGGDSDDWTLNADSLAVFEYPLNIKARNHDSRDSFSLYMPLNVRATCEPPVLPPGSRKVIPVIGIESYLSLTLEEQAEVPDFWLLQA